MWLTQWESQVDVSFEYPSSEAVIADSVSQAVLCDEAVEKAARRMVELATDVRILLRPFVSEHYYAVHTSIDPAVDTSSAAVCALWRGHTSAARVHCGKHLGADP